MNKRLYKLMNWPRVEGVVYSEEDCPHDILGPHAVGNGTLLQTFQPGAEEVEVIGEEDKWNCKMTMAEEEGFFACLLPRKNIGNYRYRITTKNKEIVERKDAYSFPSLLTENDLEKFERGIHYTIYDKLGAHPMTFNGVKGVHFAVWAPHVIRASVVGDFNGWDGRIHQMSRLEDSGIFEIFIPDAKEGDFYKFELKIRGGLTYMKADPYGFGQQLRPESASVVRNIRQFSWEDAEWQRIRPSRQRMTDPISIYELYLGSFQKAEGTEEYLNYKELAPLVISYVKEMNYTHVELMPVMEHPSDASFGYQIIGYYAPTSRYGTPEDFMFFINELHKAGIGVILDWAPASFPREEHGLCGFDGTCLYEHQDPRQGHHPYLEARLYQYGRPQVSNYLIANALYWVEKYHVDGICIAGVTSMLYLDYGKKDGEWVANRYGGNENLEAIEFLKHLNSMMKKRNPGVLMIAEESSAWPQVTGELPEGGLGFDLKWNTGWRNDYLRYIEFDPYFRRYHHHELTFSMIYAYREKFLLTFSHREALCGKSSLLGKMPGEITDQFANLRLSYAYLMMHPGKKMLHQEQDLGEIQESREAEGSLLIQDKHKRFHVMVGELNRFYRNHPALFVRDTDPDGFRWIHCISAEQCMLSFLRQTGKEEEMLVVVANFANVKQDFEIGVPLEGKYNELFNTDAKAFGGGGRVNHHRKRTEEKEADEFPYSFPMTSAPLSLSVFGYAPYTEEEQEEIRNQREEMIKRQLEQEKRAVKNRALEETREAEKKAAMALEKLKRKDRTKS